MNRANAVQQHLPRNSLTEVLSRCDTRIALDGVSKDLQYNTNLCVIPKLKLSSHAQKTRQLTEWRSEGTKYPRTSETMIIILRMAMIRVNRSNRDLLFMVSVKLQRTFRESRDVKVCCTTVSPGRTQGTRNDSAPYAPVVKIGFVYNNTVTFRVTNASV